ncbi:MAG: peroxiredoxin family protein [bacterium]|nr:peroxiredoxin family protein [bacterium]
MNQKQTDLSALSKKEKRQFLKDFQEQNRKSEKIKSLTTKLAFGFSLLLLILGLGYLWLTAKPTEQGGSATSGLAQTSNLKLGASAPSFRLPAADGRQVSLADYSGKNILLYFQEGLMCQPCWKQIGTLERDLASFEQIQTEIVTVGVDSAAEWKPILRAEGIKEIPILIDADREMSQTYGVLSMPSQMHSDRPGHTFVLVNKEGKIAWIADYSTMRVSNEEILSSVEEALKKAL